MEQSSKSLVDEMWGFNNIGDHNLVGGIPTPLKNYGVRQLG
jgi:hypothetical protein